jgi:hypothetical protein
MEEAQDRSGSGQPSAATRGRTRLIWILLVGSFGPVLAAKYVVPSLLVPLLVMSAVMIAVGVGLILRDEPGNKS